MVLAGLAMVQLLLPPIVLFKRRGEPDQSDNSAPNSGAAYVFVRNATTWTQQAYLKASNAETGDGFGGDSVAISGNTIVVGAEWEESNAVGVNDDQHTNGGCCFGAAYVFVRDGTTWTQQAYLKASNAGTDDFFGSSLAISGDTVVVGAKGEDSNAKGVNGNQNSNSADDPGAAYVFVREGTTWTQQAYLKASNTGPFDSFDWSVAISGDTVVVGAPIEDSSSRGVNGNQTNNNAENSGSAYAFAGAGLPPKLTIERGGGDTLLLRAVAIPELTYHLQRAASVAGPWSDIWTVAPDSSGSLEMRDAAPAFGRVNLRRFPYHFLFREIHGGIRITAIRHHKQDPDRGLERR